MLDSNIIWLIYVAFKAFPKEVENPPNEVENLYSPIIHALPYKSDQLWAGWKQMETLFQESRHLN